MLIKEPDAVTAVLPRFIEPMYATQVRELPEGNVWTYEAKLDGYRCLASTRDTDVALWSQRGHLFNNRFPEIARACAKLPPGTVVDGAIIAIDETGKVSFNALQHQKTDAVIQYYVFDILMHRGRSLLNTRLEVRKVQLSELLHKVGYPVILSQSCNAQLVDLIQAAKTLRLEGLVAKHKGSFYEPGSHSRSWLNYKIHRSQEFVIGGYTRGHPLGALIVGYYEADKLLYAAKVRNGFVPHLRHELAARLTTLETEDCPFANLPEKKREQCLVTRDEMNNCVWVEPICVAQIEFTEWTTEAHLRNSRFVSLREDKDARGVVREMDD